MIEPIPLINKERHLYCGKIDVRMPWPEDKPLTFDQFLFVVKSLNPDFQAIDLDFVEKDRGQIENWPKQKVFVFRLDTKRGHYKRSAITLTVNPGPLPKTLQEQQETA